MQEPAKNSDSHNLRLGLASAVLAFVALLAFALPNWLSSPSPVLNGVLNAIGVVITTFLLTSLYQELYFSRKQRDDLQRILFSPETLLSTFSKERVRPILAAAIQRLLIDRDLSISMVDIIEHNTSLVPQYNALVNITLSQPEKNSSISDHFFYDLTSFFSYDTEIPYDVLKFAVIDGDSAFNHALDGGEFIYRYRMPKYAIDELNLVDQFFVEQFSIDGEELEIETSRDSVSRGMLIKIAIPKNFQSGKRHSISFIMRERILRTGHLYFNRLRHPTHGFQCILDYSKTDIARVDCIDMMTAARNCTIRRVETTGVRKIIVDLQNTWCVPRSGVVFTWSRTRERVADVREALSAPGGEQLAKYLAPDAGG